MSERESTGDGRRDHGKDPTFLDAVLQALPAAAFVVDGVGTVLFATEPAAGLVDREADELIGESVLQFVSADTAWAYAAAVAMATDYPDVTMGPLRVELVRADGTTRAADLWATNHLDDPAIGGIVCLVTDETSAMGLAEAVAEMAQEGSLEVVADRLTQAMQGQPVNARAVMLVPAEDDPGRFVVLGTSELPTTLVDAAIPAVRAAVESGVRELHGDLTRLGDVARGVAIDAGMHALWVEPVQPGALPADGALVLWRARPGNPSPNQLRSIFQAAAIMGLAISRERYRTSC
jgi:PAS domain-containing protein